ncbi:MAG: GGDEF domain-containing protein [Desulfurella sp.]|uniref:GGDEF domain-containing protein n=1 Tax=Desulfurella sp. TaxID=1962857 RepID=UPI003D1430CD
MFFKKENNLSYIDSLKNIATHALRLLKTDDPNINETIEKYIDMIKSIKDENSMNKIRENIVNFSIKYGDFIDNKKKQNDYLIKSIINALSQIAKDYDSSKHWQESFLNIKELLKTEITLSVLENINTILKNLIFSAKDTKDSVYKELAEIIFSTLDIAVESDKAVEYKQELLALKKELYFNSALLSTISVRENLKKLIEKKEKLEEEYFNQLQEKLKQAVKALTYVMNTLTKDISNYGDEFQTHIDQIDSLVGLENIDVDEMSKKLIGIALKIKESTISMNNKIKQLSEIIEKSKNTIQQLQEKLKEAQENLIIDPLTKVYNRRGLWNFLEHEIEKARRYRKNLSIIMCDLDKFSEINNTYGHQVGDKVLEVFANTIKSLSRSSDIVTRYGGEEFLIIVPEANLDQAYLFAEKIRTATEKLKFKYKDKEFYITVSLGVAQFRQEDTIETLIERADKMLYEAKKTRNSTVKEIL